MTGFDTAEPAQVKGTSNLSYVVDPVFTIGETFNGYTPIGILDGIGAYELDDDTVRVLVNHEVRPGAGYAYKVEGTTGAVAIPGGARVSYFDIDKASYSVVDAGLAYDKIYDRAGKVVDNAAQLTFGSLNRFCSSHLIEANQFGNGIGLADRIYFTGEESDGGTEWALDTATGDLWAVPALGLAAWENVTELNTGRTDKVALLVGDDRGGAPMLLYVGNKIAGGNFLERNGLSNGSLYVWVADESSIDTPTEFNGTGNSLPGKFVEIDYYQPGQAGKDVNGDGTADFDALGYATQKYQDSLANAVSNFRFSRPEDVATNPADGTQAVLNSTGRAELFPADSWGTTYVIDVDFSNIDAPTAELKIVYDSNDAGGGQFSSPDFGIRSQDNLDWADDGYIYINEDRSFDGFGKTSGEEASIWKLDPNTYAAERIAQIDRTSVPSGQTDASPADIGNWESSGILDVSALFGQDPGELFIFDIQAHSLRDGAIAAKNLVEGGQLAFLSAATNGSKEADTLIGTALGEAIAGNDGNDLIEGRGGNDVLRGDRNNKGSQAALAGGDDTIFGGDGDDKIGGKGGNDRLFGDAGDDQIWGDAGDDLLRGGLGNDDLTGGSGSDTFVLAAGEGTDSITDFAVGVDKIALAGGLSFGSLSFSGNAISVGTETLATLTGVDTTALTSAAFVTI